MQVHLGFVEGTVGDFQKPREFSRPKATEALGCVSGCGGALVPNLFAIFDVAPHGSLCCKREDFTLQFESELPGNEIFNPPGDHTDLASTMSSTTSRLNPGTV